MKLEEIRTRVFNDARNLISSSFCAHAFEARRDGQRKKILEKKNIKHLDEGWHTLDGSNSSLARGLDGVLRSRHDWRCRHRCTRGEKSRRLAGDKRRIELCSEAHGVEGRECHAAPANRTSASLLQYRQMTPMDDDRVRHRNWLG